MPSFFTSIFQKLVKFLVLFTVVVSSLLGLISPLPILAAEEAAKPLDVCDVFGSGSCLKGVGDYNAETGQSINKLTVTIVNFLIFVAVSIAVLFIVLGGYKLIANGGDDGEVKKGKEMVVNAVLGIVVVLVSYTIVYLTASFISNLNIGS